MERNAELHLLSKLGLRGGLGCNHGRCYSCELQVARGTVVRVTSRERSPFWSH